MNTYKTFVILAVASFIFFISGCKHGTPSEIKNAVVFMKEHQLSIKNKFIPFSRENARQEIVAMYFNKDIPTVIPSDALKKELQIEVDHIMFDSSDNKDIVNALKKKFPSIEKVIFTARELNIDVLSARNDSINFSLEGNDSFIRNFDYIGGNGLRTRDEMIRLNKDPNSRYWLYEFDSIWVVINNP